MELGTKMRRGFTILLLMTLGIFALSSSFVILPSITATAQAPIGSMEDSETMGQLPLNTRLKLTDERIISSEAELHSLLDKFRILIGYTGNNGNQSLPIKELSTKPDGIVTIYYAWDPSPVVKGNYSFLMLKFLDQQDGTLARNVNYTINIENANFEQTAVAPNGLDIPIINGRIFSQGSANNPVSYNVMVKINSFNGNDVS
jgi:hypothetical protein